MPGSVDEENIDTGEIIPGRWMLEVTEMRNIQQPTASRSCRLAREYRDYIK
jgi:3-isopropylmalate dehydratase small subunit